MLAYFNTIPRTQETLTQYLSQSPQCKGPDTQEAHDKYLLNELHIKQILFQI